LLDISTKLDPFTLEVLTVISEITNSLGMDFFVIGATARDIIFNLKHGIKIERATNDIDFSIRIRSWDDYSTLANTLMENNFYSSKIVHRFTYKSIPSIDIIPFGEISIDSTYIKWPDKDAKVMSIVGFDECFDDAESFRIKTNPPLDIKIASIRGLVMMKLISWKDGFPTRSRDALDILYIIRNYIEAGNFERLQFEHSDLVDDNFDFELTGAILLGRDISKIANPQTIKVMNAILENEINDYDNSKFVSDMMLGISPIYKRDKKTKYFIQLLENLLFGLNENRL